MSLVLDGKAVSADLIEKLKKNVIRLKSEKVFPALAIVRVGDAGASVSYEHGAVKRCEEVGIDVRRFCLPKDVSQSRLISLIRDINEDGSIHGCLIFLPLPKHIDEKAVCAALAPEKDVDGITPVSQGRVYSSEGVGFPPCTAAACIAILDHYGISAEGKRCVIVGRSLVIGRPVAMMLLARNGTVTICHTKTSDLPGIARNADILIAATGKTGAVSRDCLTTSQVLIDVGIHVGDNGHLRGDVAPEDLDVPYAVTPVPGGVGAVTTTILAMHVVKAAEQSVRQGTTR